MKPAFNASSTRSRERVEMFRNLGEKFSLLWRGRKRAYQRNLCCLLS